MVTGQHLCGAAAMLVWLFAAPHWKSVRKIAYRSHRKFCMQKGPLANVGVIKDVRYKGNYKKKRESPANGV